MRLLNGADLASFIMERQLRQVRALRQAVRIAPKLVIIYTDKNPTIETFIKLKQSYAADILVDVEVEYIEQKEAPAVIAKYNKDASVHGVIVQLPLQDPLQTDEILGLLAPQKDVDALTVESHFEPATPTAIQWLLAGYNIDLREKKIKIIGNGRLVGAPLAKLWASSQYDVEIIERGVDLAVALKNADVIVSGTGQPGLLQSAMIPIDAVVVDAGVASEKGVLVGDVDSSVYERLDLTITPQKGGVGPLTVAVLFENVITAARAASK